jgi:hypothetical protein
MFFLIPFMRANETSVKELRGSKGLLKGKELIDKNFTFWTITVWEDEISMKSFRNSTSHRIAMQKLPKWCDEASYHHWVQEDREFPTWEIISEKLYSEGMV